jgi:lysozyme family protein
MAASAALPPVEFNEEERFRPGRTYGGLVGYAEGGGVDKDDPMAAYGAQGAGIGIPTEAPDIKPLEGAKPPSSLPKSVMSDITDMAKVAASVFAASDARMKDNIEQVGELYDGQPVYRYNMKGSPKTQLGLMAQDLEHNGHGDAVAGLGGVKMVDYKRATDVAAGLAPRHGFQRGGSPSFDEALRRTLSYEGGYAEDTGGPTMMGISSRANPDVNLQRVKEDPEYRSSIYRERYWNPIGADRMDPRMANVAFDTAVNLGVGRTRQLLEEAGNDPARLLQLRQQHYDNLIARDPETYGRYGRGWSNRVNDLMAYAGEQGQAPASAEINRVAGAPRGLGQARPPASETAAPTPQERSALAGFLPVKFGTRTVANPKGEEFGGVGEFLTSRQFVQPLLEGIGAMASSQSLSGVGAALQGLGAASRAYTGLEKEMAGIQTEGEQARLVQAQTEEAKAATARANVRTLGDGTTVINYFDPKTGGYKTIRSYEYFDLPEELKPALSALDRQKLESAAEFDRRRAAEAKPAGAAGQPATTTTAATPPGEAAATPRVDTKLSPDAISAARDEARELQRMQMGPDRNKAIEENLRIASEARKQRDASLRLTGNLNDLAKPLAGLSAGQQIAPGVFSKVLSMGAKIINSAATQLNLPEEYRVAAEGASQYELAQKAARILTEAKAANLDQRAVSALTTLEQGLADPSKQGDTIAEILAAAYVEKQKGLEEARFIDSYSRSAGAGITVAKNASSLFRNQAGTRDEDFLRDQAIIKEFLKAKIQEPGPSQGRSLLSFLLQQNPKDPLQKKITPEIINQMYGADIARYFLNK